MEIIKIKNVRIIDKYTDKLGTVTIVDGKISENYIDDDLCNIIDGIGLVIMPAFADLHSHFRDPGYTYKEDILTASKAAVRGGYTSAVVMANTNPVCANMEVYNYVKSKAQEIGLVDVEPVIAISEGLKGESIEHLEKLDKCVKFLSDDGKGVMSSKMMEDALTFAKKNDMVVMSHAEDTSFSKADMRKAENYMTLRDLYACHETGGRLHLCHVSTKEAISMLKDAKSKNVNVTCEVTPHHIFFNSEMSNYRVNPPIRQKKDVEAIISAINEDIVFAIATDHAPHSEEDKRNGSPGMCGLETAFSVCYTKLVKQNNISLNKLSELMSYNPCSMMRLNKGLIKHSYDADLVLIDINKKVKINVNEFASKSKNSPFDSYELYGEIVTTIKNGKIVYNN
ncbi:dihydroorotase [Sedimentibacter sp. zth1]|uniref:dihydroorotase n=1 Tax=Sedimentibacter sp. zth1 TaxID=2816908 RepID=UPI001A933A29|nr:dihydroorotase [Sedimentibacter sp. zth1]QSX07376.1 dihydroorotase [Sedimentibacter sp. zth1]